MAEAGVQSRSDPASVTKSFTRGRGAGGPLIFAASGLVLGTALAASLVWPPRPMLVWNASPSASIGLYALTSPTVLRAGDVVVAWPPPAARRLAAGRGYLPFTVPLVKRVAALGGDRICARGRRIFIDGRATARRQARDPSGRRMPAWSGCLLLKRGEVLLLSPAGPLAFDGRYFGVTRASELVGKAHLLWRGSK